MTDPTPLVTASRDALAEGLCVTQAEMVGNSAPDAPCDYHQRHADALLASGVVRAVDGLAEDEALVGDLAQRIDPTMYDETFEDVRVILRALAAALAAALATPTDPSEDEK